jgi:RNA polymerase sigma-70 factor (ECF subfamily)
MSALSTVEFAESVQAGLVRKARLGDLAAFEQILRLHERRVYLTALRLLGRPEDAQDAAQEVFLRLHRNLARLERVEDLSPWLYRVTVNVCRDLARERSRHSGSPPDENLLSSAAPDPAAQLSLAERRRLAAAALARLSEKERAAVVLRDIEGLSTREVARILGSAEVTVRTHISRARRKMKTAIERWLGRRP